MLSWDNIFPEWKNKGTEPSAELKNSGFAGGYKPPASIFNWFWGKVMDAIKELQSSSENLDEKIEEYNQTAAGSIENTNSRVFEVENSITIVDSRIVDITSNEALIFDTQGGFAAGQESTATKGGSACGKGANSVSGGAGGLYAKTETGGSLGQNAESKKGLGGGLRAKAGDGVAAGMDAVCGMSPDGKTRLNNIQLGAGKNTVEKSAKFYEYTMMNPDGTIPKERLSLLEARRYATVVIGTTQSGYEAGQVDYLCDGSNDADIINQAIQSLPTGDNANGGTMQLLPGEYVINSTININKPGVTIMGAGAASTVFVTTAFESAVIKITSNNADIKNIGIYQFVSIGDGQGMGIYVTTDNAYGVNICNCDITGYYYGVNITNAGYSISVCNNNARNNTIGLHINSQQCRASTNYLSGNNESGIRIEGSKNMITNNMMTRAKATDGDYYIGNNILLASGASDNMVVNNMILGMDVVDNGTNNLVDNNKY